MLDGASRVPDLVARSTELGMPALAMTDHGSMFGAIPFYEECLAGGIKPLMGCEVYLAQESRTRRDPVKDKTRYHLVLLAETFEGYRNLLKLVSLGYSEGFYYKPRIDLELLAANSKGLVGLTACLAGPVDQAILAGGKEAGRKALQGLAEALTPGSLYMEMMCHGIDDEKRVAQPKLELAKEFGLPLVVTNDSHYTHAADAKMHSLLLCIQTGKTLDDKNRLEFDGAQFWFKTPDEMLACCGEPTWLRRTMEVAERCNVEIPLGNIQMPRFAVPEGFRDEPEYLRYLCEQMLPSRYDASDPAVRERMEYELDIIIQKNYAGYFLVVYDICRFSRERGILIGFRGSAGGSLVAYILRIHDLDPLKLGLFFERFLNPERDDPPDIDLDLPDDRRQEVIEYVTRRYGEDHVAQVCTFGTLQAKNSVRDAGRALGIPLPDVDRIAKLIREPTIAKSIKATPELQEAQKREPAIEELLSYAQKVEGLVRHASTHAAAVVIGRDPLVEWTPLFRVSDEEGATTQFEMDALKRVGIEKLDLLGLKTLTVLARALEAIERRHGLKMTLQDIPLDDAATYAHLSRGETSAVFQLESSGMRKLVMDLQPVQITDMLPLVALYRPGPIQTGELDRFVRRRQGKEKVTYFHPVMAPILEETFGVMVYQEQIMGIARDMGGFTLGQADILRSAMGKKKRDVMDRMREVFIQGAVDRGHTGEDAAAIFDNMAEFAAYCFNKPHSAMYGIIAYYTAYLKTNYTAEFMSAQLTSFMDSKDRVSQYIEEANRLGVEMRPPDINESDADFAVDSEGHIRFGLAAIKGVGRAAVQGIFEARTEAPFTSLFDLCQRAPSNAVNRAVLEALIRAGAFDRFGTRAAHLAILDIALSLRQQTQKERDSGQESLFGGDDEPGLTLGVPELPDIEELPADELLEKEKELLGFYVSDNPVRKLAGRLEGRVSHSSGKLSRARDGETVTIGGLISGVRPYTTKNGKPMAFVTLQDHEGDITSSSSARSASATASSSGPMPRCS
jgi:DNA polymerase III subunit alpha